MVHIEYIHILEEGVKQKEEQDKSGSCWWGWCKSILEWDKGNRNGMNCVVASDGKGVNMLPQMRCNMLSCPLVGHQNCHQE